MFKGTFFLYNHHNSKNVITVSIYPVVLTNVALLEGWKIIKMSGKLCNFNTTSLVKMGLVGSFQFKKVQPLQINWRQWK